MEHQAEIKTLPLMPLSDFADDDDDTREPL
jgi:hypothetical protein